MRQIPGDNGYIYGIGNVTYISTEGGFYGIVVDTGGKSGVVQYLPLDLDHRIFTGRNGGLVHCKRETLM